MKKVLSIVILVVCLTSSLLGMFFVGRASAPDLTNYDQGYRDGYTDWLDGYNHRIQLRWPCEEEWLHIRVTAIESASQWLLPESLRNKVVAVTYDTLNKPVGASCLLFDSQDAQQLLVYGEYWMLKECLVYSYRGIEIGVWHITSLAETNSWVIKNQCSSADIQLWIRQWDEVKE